VSKRPRAAREVEDFCFRFSQDLAKDLSQLLLVSGTVHAQVNSLLPWRNARNPCKLDQRQAVSPSWNPTRDSDPYDNEFQMVGETRTGDGRIAHETATTLVPACSVSVASSHGKSAGASC